jgi:hypothetical protein
VKQKSSVLFQHGQDRDNPGRMRTDVWKQGNICPMELSACVNDLDVASLQKCKCDFGWIATGAQIRFQAGITIKSRSSQGLHPRLNGASCIFYEFSIIVFVLLDSKVKGEPEEHFCFIRGHDPRL